MPAPRQIVTSLGDTSAIDSYQVLQAEITELFADLSDRMNAWDDKRPSRIMRKMASTAHTVPYDMLAEFGHSYNPTLLCLVALLHCWRGDIPDYTDANDLVQIMLDDLRSMNIDQLNEEAINTANEILKGLGRTRP